MTTQKELLEQLIESNKQILDILKKLENKQYYHIDKVEFSTGGGCTIYVPYIVKEMTINGKKIEV